MDTVEEHDLPTILLFRPISIAEADALDCGESPTLLRCEHGVDNSGVGETEAMLTRRAETLWNQDMHILGHGNVPTHILAETEKRT